MAAGSVSPPLSGAQLAAAAVSTLSARTTTTARTPTVALRCLYFAFMGRPPAWFDEPIETESCESHPVPRCSTAESEIDGSLLLLPRRLGTFKGLGLICGEFPRLRELHPLFLYLRIEPITTGSPAALQELLMALRRVQAS
jgi:hypothetical protein